MRHGQGEGKLTEDGQTPPSQLLQEAKANKKPGGKGPIDAVHLSLMPREQRKVEKGRILHLTRCRNGKGKS